MPGQHQLVDIVHLFYSGQAVELDCHSLYIQLGLSPKLAESAREMSASDLLERHILPDKPEHKLRKLPAFVTARIAQVRDKDFTMQMREVPQVLSHRLRPELKLHLLLVDPNGLFGFSGRLLETSHHEQSLRVERAMNGEAMTSRRYIRVAVRGQAFFLSEEVREGEREGTLLDLGGAGVKVETTVSWLKVGDELTMLIETGFLDEHKEKHVSLDVTVPARVVWLRQSGGTPAEPVFHVGLAFTEISIHDQDRLISFILAYEEKERKSKGLAR
jgi:hypothetical protein